MINISDIFTVANLLDSIATITALMYIYYIKQQNILAWYCAIISSGIVTYSSLAYGLYFLAILNGLYVLLAFYGFYKWIKKIHGKTIVISSNSSKSNYLLILLGIILSLILYVIFNNNPNIKYPYLEIPIFTFSIIATFLQANKILVSWIYFAILNFLSIIIYGAVGSYWLTILFFVYFILSIVGYKQWKKQFINAKNI